MDLDGNYNIQVLTEALKVYGTEITPLRNSEAVKMLERDMDKIEALIFNSSTHWFAIRKIDNIWFNLNSTNSMPGPEIISEFFLSAFIKGAEDIGFTNFLVSRLPRLMDLNDYSNLATYQRLAPIEDIIRARDSKRIADKERDLKAKAKSSKLLL